MTKQYIGDGVYVEVERGMLKLTSSQQGGVTNTIYLEPEVYQELMKYSKAVEMEVQAEHSASSESIDRVAAYNEAQADERFGW